MSQSTKIEPPARAGQVQRPEPAKEHPKQQRPQAKPPGLTAGGGSSERAEILHRVATFRAHQVKLRKDREKYYEGVQERIRTALENRLKAKPM